MASSTLPTQVVLPLPYKMLRPVGQGTYGCVWACHHEETGHIVAVKKYLHVFDDVLVAKRALREIRIMRHFQHENLLECLHVCTNDGDDGTTSLFMVSPLLDMDLYELMGNTKLSIGHVKLFTYQMLRGLKALHSAGLMHRDLKPNNILITRQCDLKICDFGMGRGSEDQQDIRMTLLDEVNHQYYRAPEGLLDSAHYSKPIDMWAAGCIAGAMLIGDSVFQASGGRLDQLQLICQVIGKPSAKDIALIDNVKHREFIASLPDDSTSRLEERFLGVDGEMLDLLTRLLCWSATDRLTSQQALEHPLFGAHGDEPAMHDPQDEPDSELFSWEWEGADGDLTLPQYRKLLLAEAAVAPMPMSDEVPEDF